MIIGIIVGLVPLLVLFFEATLERESEETQKKVKDIVGFVVIGILITISGQWILILALPIAILLTPFVATVLYTLAGKNEFVFLLFSLLFVILVASII